MDTDRPLTHLSLFSGIGGLDLAAEWAGFKTVGQCEFADYPTKVLEKHWPDVPRWRDIRTLTKESFYERAGRTMVDGKRMASHDERDLWSELFRVYREIGARWLVAENVPGLLSSENGRFFGRVLRDLAQAGNRVWWYCFPAYATGTTFRGDRIAIVASSDCQRWACMDENKKIESKREYCTCPEPPRPGQEHLRFHVSRNECNTSGGLPRNDDGIPEALDRLKCIGNAVVPQQFYPIFQAIMCVERSMRNGDK